MDGCAGLQVQHRPPGEHRGAVVLWPTAGEVLGLGVGDVDLKSGWLKVRSGRGVKDRLIPMAPAEAEIIADWVEFRPEVGARLPADGSGGEAFLAQGGGAGARVGEAASGACAGGVTPRTLRLSCGDRFAISSGLIRKGMRVTVPAKP